MTYLYCFQLRVRKGEDQRKKCDETDTRKGKGVRKKRPALPGLGRVQIGIYLVNVRSFHLKISHEIKNNKVPYCKVLSMWK